jgi:hypothetical protein
MRGAEWVEAEGHDFSGRQWLAVAVAVVVVATIVAAIVGAFVLGVGGPLWGDDRRHVPLASVQAGVDPGTDGWVPATRP